MPRPDRPHDVAPSLESARVVLAIKNFSTVPGVCHIGLGVTATNTMKVLRKAGVHAEAWSIGAAHGTGSEYRVLRERLVADYKKVKVNPTYRPVTHVIVSAPSWIQPQHFYDISLIWPDVTFVQLNHSGCAYLSIDKYGIRNIRDVAAISEMVHNLKVAANNERTAHFISALGVPALYLPNLYDTDSFTAFTPQRIGHTLRVGSFGASRPWKNQLCAAEGAVMLAKALGVNLELYVNSKRPDGGERMIESRAELFAHMPDAVLKDVPWASWPQFRDISRNMHLLVQPSFDETFNVCTMDGIAEGVPSVAASAIEWTPRSWWAEPEDPTSIMRVGIALLHAPSHAIEEARTLAKRYTGQALSRWLDFVTGKAQLPY